MNAKEGRIVEISVLLHMLSSGIALVALGYLIAKQSKKVLLGAVVLHIISAIIAFTTSVVQTERIISTITRK